jgi:hypothetical protein
MGRPSFFYLPAAAHRNHRNKKPLSLGEGLFVATIML